ncbi:hypothetical protein FGG52_gp01 [Mycobacterium phage Backyardigan]|uniref:Uncharacterized protein n=1 Tax=Mycobacterium phage Backyardigan TaxID=2902881 RepID=G1BKX4_9CAUD|nr:hypothetical protein FGG52_gp01 [Mycobacterium phage Backyardigan]AEJ94572.1 hypothetical protein BACKYARDIGAN_1 [Mycobacterium phage Backyardigan]
MAAVARCLQVGATVVVASADVVHVGCLPEATASPNLAPVAGCCQHRLPVVLVPVGGEPTAPVGRAPARPRI